ncbi:pectinesterase 2.1 [Quercus suber]|uniref:Pectinesterase n=1 Tax=Quercus suber TaxID=58331 RepID=A0AAW0K856_QUESU
MVSEVVKDSKTIMLQMSLEESTSAIQKAIDTAKNVNQRINNNPRKQAALLDCVDLMDLSMDRVFDSKEALQNMTTSSVEDAHAWLSSVFTNHVTCLDGLEGSARTTMEPGLKDLISGARTSLAMLVAVSSLKTKVMIDEPLNGEFPTWVTSRDRTLLQALPKEIKANVVVAEDGSGKYKTVKEAVASAPNKGKTRYVIYVKKGKYKENVEVGKSKKNLMIVGDGMSSTIITGSLNFVDGTTTFNSATVGIHSPRYLVLEHSWATEAPSSGTSRRDDQSVINRCRIDAYQYTLYAHSNCRCVPKLQTSSPKAHEWTGQHDIIASPYLKLVKGSIRSYLGRSWKEYSRTVVMQSYIGDHIDPTRWSVWDKDFALETLYYREYNNKRPGASTSKRVKWSGYHVITSAEEAKRFIVAKLIQGGTWLKSSGVAYTGGL